MVLPREVDARWNLVQISWGLRLGTRQVAFEMAPDDEAVDLYAPARLRRGPITGVRDVLSGYQDGRCAYCHEPFTDIGTSRMAVDHVLPFVLMSREWEDGDLHQVWNLVLACYACNSAKRDRPPAADWMPWLERCGEYLIASHHPLRETLISQLSAEAAVGLLSGDGTGSNPGHRGSSGSLAPAPALAPGAFGDELSEMVA